MGMRHLGDAQGSRLCREKADIKDRLIRVCVEISAVSIFAREIVISAKAVLKMD
jgi:hypothetical protein